MNHHSKEENRQYAIAFTNAYKTTDDIYLREAYCLDIQFPFCMMDMQKDDVFCGRRCEHMPISVMPQSCGMGYFLEEDFSEIDDDIKGFWLEQNTKVICEKEYSKQLKKCLFTDKYETDAGVAFPLYRISGTQLDYEKLLTYGISGLKNELTQNSGFHKGAKIALDIVIKTIDFYQRFPHSDKDCLERIKDKPRTFKDALQLVLLYWSMSGSYNFGRMDTYLSPFYCNDIDSGLISESEALELLKAFWRMIGTFNRKFDSRITIGGRGRVNEEQCDRFALLAIEATRRLHEIVPQLALRFYRGQNQILLEKSYDCIGEGCTYPMLYNDDVNIIAVKKAFNISETMAMDYCPYGCGEYVIYKKSLGTPSGIINLAKALEITLNNGKDIQTDEKLGLELGSLEDFKSYEELFETYKKQVEYFVSNLAKQEEIEYLQTGKQVSFLLCSLLMQDCISRNLGMLNGGIIHLGGTLESYGNTNTADSLNAIKYCIYEKNLLSPKQLLIMLKNNFKGYSKERKILKNVAKYGNDDDYADKTLVEINEHLCKFARLQAKQTVLDSYLVVIINNEVNSLVGLNTGASADGRLANTYLANANMPYNGNDKMGITFMLNSILKPPSDIHAGSVQNLRFSKDIFNKNREKVKILLDSYFENGGTQAMITVVGKDDLMNALKEPEKYKNLIVRVGGFSERFLNLSPEVQREVLERTCY